jgi:hypothetical protein
MAHRRETVKREAGRAIYPVLGPGDQIIAGTWALTGPSPAWDLLPGLPAIAGGVSGGLDLFSSISVPVFGVAAGAGVVVGSYPLTLAVQLRRRPVFIAVTQRELICYRLSRIGNEPVSLLFRAPLAAVRVTRLGSAMPRWRSVRYTGPGAESRGLRLNVGGRWRQDLDEVLTALQAGGAAVGTSQARSQLPAGTGPTSW